MNTVLWIIQGLLCAFFIMPGLGKLSKSKEEHIKDRHIKPHESVVPIRLLGVSELLGCVGIIVPWLSGIAPVLTPITAVCFCLIMTAGIVVHTKRREYKMLPMLAVVFVLSAVLAYFRFKSL